MVLIIGTGAMACLFAAKLAAVKVPIMMLGTWREGLEALGSRGVCQVNGEGCESYYKVDTILETGKAIYSKQAIMLVKSWQTALAAQRLSDLLAPDGVVLTLQNGLGNREILVDVLGEDRVAVGVTTTGATLLGPGRVRPGGEGRISLEMHPRIVEFLTLFNQAGFDVEIKENLEGLIWGKLVVNTAINPLTTLLRVPNGDLLSNASCRMLLRLVANETAAVANARRICLPFGNPAAYVESVAYQTSLNYSSMLQDIIRGAPTEIDAICGAVTQIGEEIDVATPVNHILWLLVKAAVSLQRSSQDE